MNPTCIFGRSSFFLRSIIAYNNTMCTSKVREIYLFIFMAWWTSVDQLKLAIHRATLLPGTVAGNIVASDKTLCLFTSNCETTYTQGKFVVVNKRSCFVYGLLQALQIFQPAAPVSVWKEQCYNTCCLHVYCTCNISFLTPWEGGLERSVTLHCTWTNKKLITIISRNTLATV